MLREHTKSKYIACIKDCYETKVFHQYVIRNKYNIDNNVFVALHQCNCIVHKDNKSHWTDVVLTEEVLNNVLSVLMHIRGHKNTRRTEKRHYLKESKQLQIEPIKPIKRVERTQPAPVQEEPICDNSNSKMFLIMAVGAAIGFLVATIIWK